MKFTEDMFNQKAEILVDKPLDAELFKGDIVKVYVENKECSYVWDDDDPGCPWMIKTDQVEFIKSEGN